MKANSDPVELYIKLLRSELKKIKFELNKIKKKRIFLEKKIERITG